MADGKNENGDSIEDTRGVERVFKAKKIAEQPSAISSLRILRALRAVLSTHILAYSSVFRILRIEHPKILPQFPRPISPSF
jgi:hypothetical protein